MEANRWETIFNSLNLVGVVVLLQVIEARISKLAVHNTISLQAVFGIQNNLSQGPLAEGGHSA